MQVKACDFPKAILNTLNALEGGEYFMKFLESVKEISRKCRTCNVSLKPFKYLEKTLTIRCFLYVLSYNTRRNIKKIL